MSVIFQEPSTPGRWSRLKNEAGATLRYWMQTEVHVYALAIAASAMLSFYPFLIVILSFCRDVLHWRAAVDAIYLALNDYLPGDVAAFLKRNLPARGPFQPTAMVLLLITANGIFEPLEVALNRAWGVVRNRSYLKNQLVSLGMIFLCGGFALLSLILTAMSQEWIRDLAAAGQAHPPKLQLWAEILIFKVAAVPVSMLVLFLIYWLLPNRRIRPACVAPSAVVVGLLLEAMKYVFLVLWPLLRGRLEREYGVFHNSVTILIWTFTSAMVVLAAAQWMARCEVDHDEGLAADRAG